MCMYVCVLAQRDDVCMSAVCVWLMIVMMMDMCACVVCSGKSTLLSVLSLGHAVETCPTIGLNVKVRYVYMVYTPHLYTMSRCI